MPPKRRDATPAPEAPTATTSEPTDPPASPSGVSSANDAETAAPAVTVEEMTSEENVQAEITWAWNRIKERYGAVLALLDDDPGTVQRRLSALSVPQPGAVFAAMWAVMRDVQGVGKHGTMDRTAGGYQFRKYDDLKRELGAACRTHGVGLQSRILHVVNEQRGTMTRVQVQVMYRFTSLADGSEMTFESVGESVDKYDKATGKAMTMALKTALDQAFMLAAEDIEDPDASRPEPDEVPREARQDRRDQTVQRREPHPTQADLVAAQRAADAGGGPREVMDAAQNGYPNEAPTRTDPWDQGPPADTRTPQELAQAAADALNAPGMTMDKWQGIADHARKLEIMEQVVRTPTGDEMALKRWLIAVSRTL